MKKLLVVISVCSLVVLMTGLTNVYALDFGSNITIYDKWDVADPSAPGNTWYTSHNEDQELEFNSLTGDAWDLEAFFLNGSMLNMMGTYNFMRTDEYKAGDIFIDVNGDAKYGADALLPESKPLFGYEYVLDMDFAAQTFSIVKLTAGSTLLAPAHVQAGAPWRYDSGGEVLGTGYTFGYNAEMGRALTDAESGMNSDSADWTQHNVVSLELRPLIDLGLFNNTNLITLHTTMECGNDNLMGQFDPNVPEPGTVLLLGSGLIGIAALLRKRGNK